MSNFFYKIGLWIRDTYYWFLWNAGFPDADGNYNTIYDRVPITQLLRTTKMRLGYLWYILSFGTFTASIILMCKVSLWYLILVIFFWWLLAHVLETAKFPEERR